MDLVKEFMKEDKDNSSEEISFNKELFEQYEDLTAEMFEKMKTNILIDLKIKGHKSSGEDVERKIESLLYPIIDNKINHFLMLYMFEKICELQGKDVDLKKEVITDSLMNSIVDNVNVG